MGALDVWVDPTPENVPRVLAALAEFGAPLTGVDEAGCSRPGIVFQMGLAPSRDRRSDGPERSVFRGTWPERLVPPFRPTNAPFVGRAAFVKNKRASGRQKDMGDLDSLGEPITPGNGI
jgi:hypothetical protein